ncbi:hypothetical protein COB57_03875 [Candidatus Peregrinibacteria bacterium]|nr:MAG: hypothetical protein COB57_03875 [Candidatus Peregrinibacteria bacterium]
MKKIILFICLLVLSSCSLYQAESIAERGENPQEKETVEFIGKIEAMNLSYDSSATHKIMINETSSKLLTSQGFSLVPFEGKEVHITGRKNKKNIIEVQNIEEIIEESPEEFVIEWIDFSDSLFPLAFSFPNIWSMDFSRNAVTLSKEDTKIIKITAFPKNESDLSAQAPAESVDITVAGLAAKRTEGEETNIYVLSGKQLIKISFFGDTEDKGLFFELLDTVALQEAIDFIECRLESPCDEGLRCELIRGSIGQCVPLDYTAAVTHEGVVNEKVAKSAQVSDTKPEEEKKEAPVENPDKIIKEVLPEEIKAAKKTVEIIDGRSYENPYLNFALQYPKNWWFRSFGSDKGMWYVEFGEKEIEEIGDGNVQFQVEHGARGNIEETEGSLFCAYAPRDTESHFQICGPENIKDEMKMILGSVKNTL